MRKLKVNLLLLAVLVFSAGILKAQEGAKSFTLQEAQDFAVKNGYQSLIAQKEVLKSEKVVKETIGTGLPQIAASGSYQKYIEEPQSLIPKSAFGGPEGEFEEVFFGTNQQTGINFRVDQLIFDGSYFVGLQAAKVYLEISKNDQLKSEIEIKNKVTQAYGNVLVAENNAKILKSNKENLDKIVYETGELYNNGFAEEQDKEQFELLLSNTVNAYEQSVRQIDVSKNQLKFVLGLSLETSLELKDKLEVVTALSNSSDFASIEFNINNHIDYKSILIQEKASELLWKQQKSTALPRLSGFYNLSANAYSQEFDFFDKKYYPGQVLGLNLNIPIFSGFSRTSRIQQAKLDMEITQIAKTQVEQQLKIQADNSKSEYLFAKNQYENANNNLVLAEKIYDKVKAKYDEGINSSLELTQANNQLLETQGNFINASFQLINAKVNLDKALNNY
jgi:outer membrane protein TolC